MRDDVGCFGLLLLPVGLSLPFWFSDPTVTRVTKLNLAVALVVLGLLLFFVIAPRLPEGRQGSRRRGSGAADDDDDDCDFDTD